MGCEGSKGGFEIRRETGLFVDQGGEVIGCPVEQLHSDTSTSSSPRNMHKNKGSQAVDCHQAILPRWRLSIHPHSPPRLHPHI